MVLGGTSGIVSLLTAEVRSSVNIKFAIEHAPKDSPDYKMWAKLVDGYGYEQLHVHIRAQPRGAVAL